jgi:hypothetical protein
MGIDGAPRAERRHSADAAATRRARTTRPTVDRLTPIMRASACCVASGFAAISLSTFAHTSGGSRSRPIVWRPAELRLCAMNV